MSIKIAKIVPWSSHHKRLRLISVLPPAFAPRPWQYEKHHLPLRYCELSGESPGPKGRINSWVWQMTHVTFKLSTLLSPFSVSLNEWSSLGIQNWQYHMGPCWGKSMQKPFTNPGLSSIELLHNLGPSQVSYVRASSKGHDFLDQPWMEVVCSLLLPAESQRVPWLPPRCQVLQFWLGPRVESERSTPDNAELA